VVNLEDKKIRLKIPAGTQDGKMFRVKYEGIPFINDPGRRGDMYIKIRVQVPTKLSGKAKSLLKELADIEGEDAEPRPIPLAELRSQQ
jgi:molecular chaperone DnaJ